MAIGFTSQTIPNYMSLHKTYEQAKAAHKPMGRRGFPRPSYEEARLAADRRHAEDRLTVATGQRRPIHRKPMNKIGPRATEWSAAWRFLKPRLQAAGRTRCEFDWPDVAHECWGPLDPAHSKKRHEMQEGDIYAVAISCREFHNYLDQVCSHSRMEELVLEAINRHGGMILPKGSV